MDVPLVIREAEAQFGPPKGIPPFLSSLIAGRQSVATQTSTTDKASPSAASAGTTVLTKLPFGSSTTATLEEPAPTGNASGASTHKSSTFATQTTSQSSTSDVTNTPSTIQTSDAGSTAFPDTTPKTNHHGMAAGSVAAAVVIPVVLLLLLSLLAFFCYRRQSRKANDGAPRTAFLPSMREKMDSLRKRNHPPPTAAANAVVTSNTNNSYYTGLDTSSQGSRAQSDEYYASRGSDGGTFVEPPPPYKAKGSLRRPRAVQSTGASSPMVAVGGTSREAPRASLTAVEPVDARHRAIPLVRGPVHLDGLTEHDHAIHNENTDDSTSNPPHAHLAFVESSGLGMPMAQAAGSLGLLNIDGRWTPTQFRPGTPHSTAGRSITSTLYSDSASVHSARAVAPRLSVGGAGLGQIQMVESPGHSPTQVSPGPGGLDGSNNHDRDRGSGSVSSSSSGGSGFNPFRDPTSPMVSEASGEEWHSVANGSRTSGL